MIKDKYQRMCCIVVLGIMSLTLTLSGCDTLKRKFTRKKKAQAEDMDFNPVLEPQEYPAPESNPAENYKQHYALLKVWYQDLWSNLQDKATDKKMAYTLKQIKAQIEIMRTLVTEDKQKELDKLAGFLKYFDEALLQPSPLRNKVRMESDLRSFYHQLLAQLTFAKVKGQLIQIKK